MKCKRCGMKLTNKKSIELGYGATCFRIIQLNNQETKQETKKPEKFDMGEIKSFITLEIEKALKDFNFNRPNNDKSENIGIIPKKIKKMPKFNPLEVSKRMIIIELKQQLKAGISNILQKVGSFDNQINFQEIPVLV